MVNSVISDIVQYCIFDQNATSHIDDWSLCRLNETYKLFIRFFYRAMHFSAKRGIAIACRLSVRLSVCNVGELWSHRLEFFENNFINS